LPEQLVSGPSPTKLMTLFYVSFETPQAAWLRSRIYIPPEIGWLGFLVFILKSKKWKSTFYYYQRSDGQCILVSDTHLEPATDFIFFYLKLFYTAKGF
jgi:hypothetical protein